MVTLSPLAFDRPTEQWVAILTKIVYGKQMGPPNLARLIPGRRLCLNWYILKFKE